MKRAHEAVNKLDCRSGKCIGPPDMYCCHVTEAHSAIDEAVRVAVRAAFIRGIDLTMDLWGVPEASKDEVRARIAGREKAGE